MTIGGVPSMPNIDSSTSLKKLQASETQLEGAYTRVENLLVNNPQMQAELQNSLNQIKDNFSKIIDIRYGVTAQSVVDSLSTAQIDALTAQIADLTTQINTITANINSQTQVVTNLQNQINALNQTIAADQASLNAATSLVTHDLTNALTVMKPGTGAGQDFQNIVINPWLSSVASGNPDVAALQSNINTFLARDSGKIATLRFNGIPLTTYISTNIVSDAQAVPTDLTKLHNDQAQLAPLTQSLHDAQVLLDSFNAQLVAAQAQLADLNSQLQAAQAALNQAIQFFDSLSPVEKNLFQQLYPGVTFPA